MECLFNITTSDYYFRNRSLEGRSYFPLPEELNSMGGSINIQIEVNECLWWCWVRYLNHVSKNQILIENSQKNLILKA